MKSFFLLALILASLIKPALAQTKKKSVSVSKASQKEVLPEKSSFDKFYDRLKIGYFGAYSGSSIGHWDEKAQDEGAVRSSGYAHNLWNQISFNYNFGARMSFVLNPRFTINTGSASGHGPLNRGIVTLEDALVGVQGVFSSDDKKLSLWTRPGMRLSTSRASRSADITNQWEVLSALTYDLDKTWQFGLYQQLRHWVFEERYTAYRFRIFHSPYVQYAINDTTRLQLYYEHYLENRGNLPSQNGKNVNLRNYWQNSMLAVSYDVTPKLNVMPFLGYILDARHISEKPLDPAWLGAWISYSIK